MPALIMLGTMITAAWLTVGAMWLALDVLEALITDEPLPTWRRLALTLLAWPWARR